MFYLYGGNLVFRKTFPIDVVTNVMSEYFGKQFSLHVYMAASTYLAFVLDVFNFK